MNGRLESLPEYGDMPARGIIPEQQVTLPERGPWFDIRNGRYDNAVLQDIVDASFAVPQEENLPDTRFKDKFFFNLAEVRLSAF